LVMRLANNPALAATLRADGTGLLADKMRFALGLTFTTFSLIAISTALLGTILYGFLGRFTMSRRYRVAVTLSYGLLSVAFPYANSFYSHQLAALVLFVAFVLVCRPDLPAKGWAGLVAIGLLLGLAVVTEYPTVLIAAPLFLYAWLRLATKRRIGWVIAGGAVPGSLAASYNQAIYHTPLPVGYHYSALWQTQHSTGFMSLTYPKLDALWGIVGSPYRGLFFLSPVLLLAVAGLVLAWRRPPYRAETVLSTLAVAGFLVFNASSSMWWGGFAVGPRYLLPMLPFLAWPMVVFLERYGQAAWARALLAGLALLSLIGVWGLALAGQAFPPETLPNPWLDYAWPHLLAGDLARNAGMVLGLRGWWSLLPLPFLAGGALFLLGRTSGPRRAAAPGLDTFAATAPAGRSAPAISSD
jgi:hypothetical protein